MTDLAQLTRAVGDLDEESVLRMLADFLAGSPGEDEAQRVVSACQKGMEIIGSRYESGEYFVSDLIFSGEILTRVVESLRPVLGKPTSNRTGKIVLGTVYGDVHDIGKNIFRNMAEAAGFEVYDLGVDQPVEHFINKVKDVGAKIVGMSCLLTLAIDAMKKTVDGLKAAGLRDSVKIIIGGNPVTTEVCKYTGADAYTTNAAEGVRICKGWLTASDT